MSFLFNNIGFWRVRGGDIPVNPDSFIFQVVGSSYTLPTVNGGTYAFTVEWGDGTSDYITSYNSPLITHEYPSSDLYTIVISGTFYGIKNGDNATSQNKGAVRAIQQWGKLRIGSFGQAFRGLPNMTVTATDILDVSMETSMDSFMREAKAVTTIPNIGLWDVRNVVYMGSLFSNAFLANPNVENWVTSSLVKMGNTFYYSAFDRNIGGWDVTGVDNFSQCLNRGGHGTISRSNYDAILAGWGSQNVKTNMVMHASANYTLGSVGEVGRNALLGKGWSINDMGGV